MLMNLVFFFKVPLIIDVYRWREREEGRRERYIKERRKGGREGRGERKGRIFNNCGSGHSVLLGSKFLGSCYNSCLIKRKLRDKETFLAETDF